MSHFITVEVLDADPRYKATCSCGWGRWVYHRAVLDGDSARHLAENGELR